MNTTIKNFALRTLAVSAIAAVAMSSANAGVFFYRTRIVVAPVVAAPVIVAPVGVAPIAVAPVIAAPVAVAPVAMAPVAVAPVVYVPTCRFVSVPVVNAFTGYTYLVTRRVCN
jgi:hypothetical protein